MLSFKHIKGDLFGGLTAGIVALPLALAFGVQAFADLADLGVENPSVIGAKAGLYGAIVIGVLAALFGGTATQISGPTAPMTVIASGVIVAAYKMVQASASDIMTGEEILMTAMPIIVATFMLAGVFQLLFGVLKVGKYIKYIPYPVVSGFMSGIGIIIIVGQLFPFFGEVSPTGGTLGILKGFPHIFDEPNWYAFGMAAATVAIIYGFPKITKTVPSALVALVGLTAFAKLAMPEGTVPIIGEISAGLPEQQFTVLFGLQWSDLAIIVIPAITLAALGSIDSLLTSVVADNTTRTKHNSNKELIGQGIGNIGAALLGGLPGAGATLRTVVNIKAGGKTNLSGVLAGLFLFIIVISLGNFVGMIPKPVLAGILITVGIGIIDYKGFAHLRHVPKSDAVVNLAVLSLTVFWDLIYAVGVGMILASVTFMKKMSDIVESQMVVSSMDDLQNEMQWDDEGEIAEKINKRIFIKHLDGPIFFGFASAFSEMVDKIPEVRIVIIRMEKVPYIDQSGLYSIEEAVLTLKSKDVDVMFTGLKGQPHDMMLNLKLIPDLVPEEDCYKDFDTCTRMLKRTLTGSKGKFDEDSLKLMEKK